jgi:hypothetical protein
MKLNEVAAKSIKLNTTTYAVYNKANDMFVYMDTGWMKYAAVPKKSSLSDSLEEAKLRLEKFRTVAKTLAATHKNKTWARDFQMYADDSKNWSIVAITVKEIK